MALDSMTLDIVATMVAALLGAMLLHFGRQENTPALRWWGAAYILGAVAIALWTLVGELYGEVVSLVLSSIGLIATAMVWNAARVFHGKSPSGPGLALGATVWIVGGMLIDPSAQALRLTIGAALVVIYATLTAAELWQERRRTLHKRWPALIVPVMHGFVLMLPILLGNVLRDSDGAFAAAWVTIFSIELVLYAVGTVFVIFMLVSERIVSAHKRAATTDPLTGLLNRRGFADACAQMIDREAREQRPVSVLIFDIDHFKSINDSFGHAEGDEVLKLFAKVVVDNLRLTDLSGRIGGEEFAALLPCSIDEAMVAAERVREAFAASGVVCEDKPVDTTVSIGVAGGPACTELDVLLAAADTALYKAKRSGRNRVEASAELPLSLDRYRRQRAAVAMPRVQPEQAVISN
ncbi:putative diguanylate cyclas [Bradyrhizobium oligotrophicum S58]|uniref:diguanylate cyclase n=1 Tax=Bradyrhizobium oligotrophicum S58 TaxID=1245469 RepID=M4Z7P3_9BRAD|nr:GGDEF domain-containing protein [Bradyrhizobium oligotrophicum]BAM89372.1 putative diguanylate cyclas [Bradyrhizobium oligotrophicum S58]